MSDVNNISRDLLIKSIKEILGSADLNVMTPKLVRDELQNKLKVQELSSRKKEINAIIMEVINNLNNDNNNNDNRCNSDSKTALNISTNHSKDSKKSTDSKSQLSVETNDSNSSSDESIADEELARKLQKEEEFDSKQRVTRSNRSNKNSKSRKKTKTSKKRKKYNSDDSNDEKPEKKKKKNGYLKPCILSTELANFLGASEMPRHEVVKRIWSYVKEKNLLDPKNKQFAICDNELLKIFGRKRIRLFGMMKHLTKHLE